MFFPSTNNEQEEEKEENFLDEFELNSNFLAILNFETIEILEIITKILKSKKKIKIEEIKPEEYRKIKFLLLIKTLGFKLNSTETKILPINSTRKPEINKELKKKKLETKTIKIFSKTNFTKEKLIKELEFKILIHKLIQKVYEKEILFIKKNFLNYSIDHIKIIKIDDIKNVIYFGNLSRMNGKQYSIVIGYFSEDPILIDIQRFIFKKY